MSTGQTKRAGDSWSKVAAKPDDVELNRTKTSSHYGRASCNPASRPPHPFARDADPVSPVPSGHTHCLPKANVSLPATTQGPEWFRLAPHEDRHVNNGDEQRW